NGLSNNMRKFFDTLLKRNNKNDKDKDKDKDKNKDKDEDEDYNEGYDSDDDTVIVPCPPAKYQLLNVGADASIKDFVLSNNLKFKTGKGFYEFTKSETITPKKEIILMKKETGELFE